MAEIGWLDLLDTLAKSAAGFASSWAGQPDEARRWLEQLREDAKNRALGEILMQMQAKEPKQGLLELYERISREPAFGAGERLASLLKLYTTPQEWEEKEWRRRLEESKQAMEREESQWRRMHEEDKLALEREKQGLVEWEKRQTVPAQTEYLSALARQAQATALKSLSSKDEAFDKIAKAAYGTLADLEQMASMPSLSDEERAKLRRALSEAHMRIGHALTTQKPKDAWEAMNTALEVADALALDDAVLKIVQGKTTIKDGVAFDEKNDEFVIDTTFGDVRVSKPLLLERLRDYGIEEPPPALVAAYPNAFPEMQQGRKKEAVTPSDNSTLPLWYLFGVMP